MNIPFGGEDITRPVATPNIPDPTPGTEAYNNALAREKSRYSVEAMPWLPQLPDEWATELYERIVEAERAYAAPHMLNEEYIEGTAEESDEVAVVRGASGYLFTAEHATSPINLKTGEVRFADIGTGGLAVVLAEDYGTSLIMRGRQTSNVPSDPSHPLKPLIRRELVGATGYVGVHGKASGMFVHSGDRAEIHACIGLGIEPTEAMREFGQKIVRAARDDLGLYAVVSNVQPAYIQERKSTNIKRLEDGSPKLSRLAALPPASATNFSREVLEKLDRDIPALQMELTNLLRATPLDDKSGKDEKSRVMGVAMGYKLIEKVVALTPEYAAEGS